MTNYYLALRAFVDICNEPGALTFSPATELAAGAPVFVPLAPGAAFVPDDKEGGTDAALMRHVTEAEQWVVGVDYLAANCAAEERGQPLREYLGCPVTVATDAALMLAMTYSWRVAGCKDVEDI